ncbi:MAG: hypothetical protein A2603_01620 [Bdellovibrionales bacterium RIFOXYD1_FULL_55_31]|nr:MAG: hypothetical protein A2603_01620 [Bdellovibrionales bacterium RIFOXYD1_FULL_55_31]
MPFGQKFHRLLDSGCAKKPTLRQFRVTIFFDESRISLRTIRIAGKQKELSLFYVHEVPHITVCEEIDREREKLIREKSKKKFNFMRSLLDLEKIQGNYQSKPWSSECSNRLTEEK